jgi:uncharacterized membrane protein
MAGGGVGNDRGPAAWPGLSERLRRAWRTNRSRLALPALAIAAFGLLLPSDRNASHAALAVLANAGACHAFAATLLPGREPLISRYTRFDFGHLPPDCAGYTRSLTLLWAALLAGFAAAQVAALAGWWSASAVLAVEAVLCGALFLGEHVVRGARFPHHGPATLRRTVRAVRLAHAARDTVAAP